MLRVLQQTNSTDCGVYLILNFMHYFKPENYLKFMEDGEKFSFSDHTNWFTQEDIAEQRRNMRLFVVKNIFS